MLSLSPLFSTTYGWPSEDPIQNNVQRDCNDISIEAEANSCKSLLDFDTYEDIQHDFSAENSNSSGGFVNGYLANPMVKKLNHNASERHRRKRVNELYGFLRSLLPISSDQKKKVSIPGTVSRALKYIPELQKEVEKLKHKKEKLSSYSSSKAHLSREVLKMQKSSLVSSVRVLGATEAVIQLISSDDHMSKRKEIVFLSKVLEYLEQEEDGFILLNATNFKCSGEEMALSTLHIQVQGDNDIDAERLMEKLSSFHQLSDRLLL
ncbi:unnamed protein product [Lactuca virosa]|uniref:BHLH domain-containing protein n=1 Tax=Lactuca virosa TaxID=75947 RepID=A0AAU9N9M8_9ASTR|nr:unnamed protein product [Lactuca virosa]